MTIRWNGLELAPFLSAQDIIAITCRSRSIVYELIEREIPHIKFGWAIRVQTVDFINWVEGRKAPSPAA